MASATAVQAIGSQLRIVVASTAPLTLTVRIDVPIRKDRG
jgi:hypothetical protein